MSYGVPQRLVLGSLLWKMYYYGMLRLKLLEGSEIIAQADAYGVLVRQKSGWTLETTLYKALLGSSWNLGMLFWPIENRINFSGDEKTFDDYGNPGGKFSDHC